MEADNLSDIGGFMTAYYNEFDPNAAAWLRELIKMKLIADGDVDERSILDIQPDDLKRYRQCHFFAGIGGWSYALRLAGIPDDYPIWTASLPCQPFSIAGKQLGKKNDERHLLPHFLELVEQCRPITIVGEQVPGAIKHGWLDDLQDHLEGEGYATGATVLTAAGVGAPHIRQRLYWVAQSESERRCRGQSMDEWNRKELGGSSTVSRVANSESIGWRLRNSDDIGTTNGEIYAFADPSSSIDVEPRTMHSTHATNEIGQSACEGETESRVQQPESSSAVSRMADPTNGGREPFSYERSSGVFDTTDGSTEQKSEFGIWDNAEYIRCRDNKYRPIKPGIQPLAHGLPGRMVHSCDPSEPINANATQEARNMRLKGYGNAIVPQLAAVFIRSVNITQRFT